MKRSATTHWHHKLALVLVMLLLAACGGGNGGAANTPQASQSAAPASVCVVPKVVGFDWTNAERMVQGIGLVPVHSAEFSATVPVNQVIAQQPDSGTRLDPCKGEVRIVVSLGAVAAPTLVPVATAATLPVWVPTMVKVPAGPFLMGSTDQQIADVLDMLRQDASASWDSFIKGEQPQHTLTLPVYEIGKAEVTNAQFRPFVENDGYANRAYWDDAGWQWRTEQQRTQPNCWTEANFNGDNQPVVCVTWYEATAYARWLSAQTGQNFSLPTEAEWEKAARGTDGRSYPWGNAWDAKLANSAESGLGKTAPVGQYPGGASPYGALDMAGNAWEWTQSVYTAYPYNASDGRENLSDQAGKRFTIRGGSWDAKGIFLRAALRFYSSPAYDDQSVGVRLARHP